MDTIFALATAPGRSGVAIVRVSGALAGHAAKVITGRDIPYRKPVLRNLWGADGHQIDTALVLAFAEGESFTGEEVVEYQTHGSRAVIAALLSTLGGIPGLRLAEPGEFTRRALENEQLDLAQVEGLADLIDAETEVQRRQALTVFSGKLGALAEGWRADLIRALALLEVTIDFVDEEVPVDVTGDVRKLVLRVRGELMTEAQGAEIAERVRDGFEVALIGPPNVGKSTLLNALAGRDAAITSEVAGTTRDVIEVRMDLNGLPVTLLDTAGIRESEDEIEQIGVARTRERAQGADLRVFLINAAAPLPAFAPEAGDLVVQSKSDLGGVTSADLAVSGATGAGLDVLVARIGEVLSQRAAQVGTAIRYRQAVAIRTAMGYLDESLNEVAAGPERTEFAADAMRGALRALDSLVGRIDVEDVLDVIFKSFCLGK